MNVIFICVIVLDKMCFHMLNLCWFKHKKILSVLGVFGKYFVFTKIENFQKQCCPVLATQSQVRQVFCHSRELMSQFWRLVRKWKVRSRRVHREFHGSARNSLAGRPFSHKKHLEIFFITLTLSVLAAYPGDLLVTHPSREKRMFCVSKSVFQNLFSFPSNILWLFTFSLNLNSPKHSVSLFTTSIFALFTSKSSRKRYGLSFPHLISHVLSFIFVNVCVDVLFFSLWVCFGFWVVLIWIVEVLFLCDLVSVDRFIYYHVLVSLR